jgi:hypothetical protein
MEADFSGLVIPEGWEIVGGADTGTYTSAVLVAFSPEGKAFVIYEFPNYRYIAGVPERDETMTIPSWAAKVCHVCARLNARAVLWADRNSQFKQELLNYNIHLLSDKTPAEARTEITREYFEHNRIWLAPWLKILPFELENAKWPESASSAGKFMRVKDRDHTLDCLEHILARRPKGEWATALKKYKTWGEAFSGQFKKGPVPSNPHLGRE